MKITLSSLFQLPRFTKQLISIAVDSAAIFLALLLAYWIRLGDTSIEVIVIGAQSLAWTVFFTIAFTIVLFAYLGLYKAMLRYMTLHVVSQVILGGLGSTLCLVFVSYFFDDFVPRSIPFIYAGLLTLFCAGGRLFARAVVVDYVSNINKGRVLIYGAGLAGRQLASALRANQENRVCGFIDDDTNLQGSVIQSYPVYSFEKAKSVVEQDKIEKVLLALPRVSRSERKKIIDALMGFQVEVLSVPTVEEMLKEGEEIQAIREVPVEDLLGRDPVPPSESLLTQDITGKVVMVTGAGGSIGSEICRQVIKQKPTTIVLFEVTELALYSIDKELQQYASENNLSVRIVPLLGSVQRINRLHKTMRAFGVQTIYHAAAYKHVPMVEFNVVEGVRNNVFGTYYTAKAAIETGVETFVLISTDKAVRPTNVMGATKRMAELSIQALAEKCQQENIATRFSMVRFGNVLGSSGSVIPLFKKQIAAGGPITITHKDITRYFMTIPEASQLVIQAGAMAKGGDVFVLDMGEPVKIVDLAENLIRLSGLLPKTEAEPYGDVEITFTGLRPGEKLYEELLVGEEELSTEHSQIKKAQEVHLSYEEFMRCLDKMDIASHDYDHETIREQLLELPLQFQPTEGINDLVWNEKVKKGLVVVRDVVNG
ncbi:polysaccharide biosynthesis protein [Vibrio breoganii]|uniref:polysaccharide biosynthesis protein n=2 Tax=Vibrio TaxID=662 RepID=UPI000C858F46|nr:nucleoside-diphosphate sugar epimerase/dehydratase [Vibrio breoganii]PMG94233.1 nucleoside-diphosphate sugar epimerase [Vibrio breoganii]PMI16104.1 nucleoside-diphosphate sugar epimerase [Vibrio breoganii]TKF86910.1 polysaccharide biosynthesis protein [Vibrio breoganii]